MNGHDRPIRFWLLAILAGGLGFLSKPLFAADQILTLYSDNGFPSSTATFPVFTYGGQVGNSGWNGNAQDITPPEGYTSFKSTETVNSYIGWGFDYGSGQNLNPYSNGELRFWIYSSTGNVQVEIKDSNSYDVLFQYLNAYIGTNYNQWIEVRIPFSGNLVGSGLSSVEDPFVITATSGPCTFYVDDVRYVNTTSFPIFDVSLNNISDNSTATEITWNTLNTTHPLPQSWVLADQYIQLNVDPDAFGWGVQIYADNTTSDASPKYTGAVSSSTPGGLVDVDSTTEVLPMAWRAVATTTAPVEGAGVEPNTCVSNPTAGGCLWLYLQDHATFALGNPSVYNGAAFVTVKSNQGLHYAQGTTFDPSDFGEANPPNVLYLEGNFSSAVTPETYRTSGLRIEYYHD